MHVIHIRRRTAAGAAAAAAPAAAPGTFSAARTDIISRRRPGCLRPSEAKLLSRMQQPQQIRARVFLRRGSREDGLPERRHPQQLVTRALLHAAQPAGARERERHGGVWDRVGREGVQRRGPHALEDAFCPFALRVEGESARGAQDTS